MSKDYYLFKRGSVWYVRYRDLLMNKILTAKSTGKRTKREADKIAAEWFRDGGVPERINQPTNRYTVDEISLLNTIRFQKHTHTFVKEIINILIEQKFLESVVYSATPSAQPLVEYLTQFWDYENSEYIQEKISAGQSIHLSHCVNCQNVAKQHYRSYFKNKSVGSVTLEDIRDFKIYLLTLDLSGSRVNNILRTGTTALKYAFYRKLTPNNCFDGLIYCSTETEARDILTPEQAVRLFTVEWHDQESKLANYLAYMTGMRMGEIRALRFCDIKEDRLHVRNSYNQLEGMKCTKNGEERDIPIREDLRQLLLRKVMNNPHHQGENSFVFFSTKPDKPVSGKHWLLSLKSATKLAGYPNSEDITFHAWRHLFTTELTRVTEYNKVKKVTGHKTDVMVSHYSNHKSEALFQELKTILTEQYKEVIITI